MKYKCSTTNPHHFQGSHYWKFLEMVKPQSSKLRPHEWGYGVSVELRNTQAVRFGSVLFGLQCEWRLRRLANPCTTRHVFNAYLTQNAMQREWSDKSNAVLTTRATRSGQNGLSCQDSWRGISGASIELRTTQAVRFGSGCCVNDA